MNIYLNVYDLHEMNTALRSFNMGIHHSGVEIAGSEYSFSSAGVSRTRPKLPEFGQFREQILIGSFGGILMDIHDTIAQLQGPEGGFSPGQYNVLTRNCNHFSDQLCFTLLGVHIPSWINRAANTGASLSKTSSNGSASPPSAFPAPGVVAAPTLVLSSSTSTSQSQTFASTTSHEEPSMMSSFIGGVMSIFGWSGGSEGPSTTATVPVQRNDDGLASNKKAVNTAKPLTDKQKDILAKLKK